MGDIKLKQLIKEYDDRYLSEVNIPGASLAGAGIGVGASTLWYYIKRRKLHKEMDKCGTEDCKRKIREELIKLKSKAISTGVTAGVAGAAGGMAVKYGSDKIQQEKFRKDAVSLKPKVKTLQNSIKILDDKIVKEKVRLKNDPMKKYNKNENFDSKIIKMKDETNMKILNKKLNSKKIDFRNDPPPPPTSDKLKAYEQSKMEISKKLKSAIDAYKKAIKNSK